MWGQEAAATTATATAGPTLLEVSVVTTLIYAWVAITQWRMRTQVSFCVVTTALVAKVQASMPVSVWLDAVSSALLGICHRNSTLQIYMFIDTPASGINPSKL